MMCRTIASRLFQSTLPRRERRYSPGSRALGISFQSTLPRRERPLPFLSPTPQLKYFNPRSREGSDTISGDSADTNSISIHAPAKGATVDAAHISTLKKISIHAPAKGATVDAAHISTLKKISIHAPAKGATIFQTDHPLTAFDFNPRSREGSDFMRSGIPVYTAFISIHAPAKGATADLLTPPVNLIIFQSTLPRRERRAAKVFLNYCIDISIHAPAKGATYLEI